jgi:hypothetical protein
LPVAILRTGTNPRVKESVPVSIDPDLFESRDISKHNVYRLSKNGYHYEKGQGDNFSGSFFVSAGSLTLHGHPG